MKYQLMGIWLGLLLVESANAGTVTGTIQTLHVNIETRRAHVQLQGLPFIDGGGCSSYWTANSLDDTDFMKYIWPLLLTAKATGTPVTITANGCIGPSGRIVHMDLEPRLAN